MTGTVGAPDGGGYLIRVLEWMRGRETRNAARLTHGRLVPQWFGHQTASGVHVNSTLAENLGTVTACVNAIGTVMGSLPAGVPVR